MAAEPSAKTAERVRLSYEKLPYPAVAKRRGGSKQAYIFLLDWVQAMWQPGRKPARILIAGCGTGSEAFALTRTFPEAKIVAADFSARSIQIARKRQRDSLGRKTIQFIRADLAATSFVKLMGARFDFISCHGVLTYIPQAAEVLRNLAASLTEDGALYLGVNGASHYSEYWRDALPAFGFQVSRFESRARCETHCDCSTP